MLFETAWGTRLEVHVTEDGKNGNGGNSPYWQYTRQDLEEAAQALKLEDPNCLAAIASIRDKIGTKACMSIVMDLAKGQDVSFERLMRGRE